MTIEETAKLPSPATSINDENDADYKHEGRRYHDNANAAYVLPEDELENDRMLMQHYAVKGAFGANFDTPIEKQLKKGITVLDSGSGPGAWTLDMAKAYPASKFHALDISSVFPTETKPVNVDFQIHNIIEPVPFPDSYFDFIHQRLLVMGIRKSEWKTVIGNYMRALKPGGWFEFTECTADMLNGGPKMVILMDALRTISDMKGLHIGVYKDLESYLKEAGACNVTARPLTTPLNHANRIGELLWKDYCMMFSAMRPVVGKAHPELASEEAYTNFLAEAGEECKEYKTGLIWCRCYGQKPAVAVEN